MLKDEWEVYIIQTRSGKFYTGITKDLERRFQEHHNQKKGARFFQISQPEKIVFREKHFSRSEATKREIYIKKLNRQQKIELINFILPME
jgi:putative endonuclease